MPPSLAAFGNAAYIPRMTMQDAIAVPLDYARIEQGVSAALVQEFIGRGLISREDVYRAVPERTFKRRLAEKGNLKTEEADAIARTDCKLVPVNRHHFLYMVDEMPQFALHVMKGMADRLRNADKRAAG